MDEEFSVGIEQSKSNSKIRNHWNQFISRFLTGALDELG